MTTRTTDTSDKQPRILAFIKSYIALKGHPPTLREMRHGCGISSLSVVSYNVKKLVGRGLLRTSQNPDGRPASRSYMPTGNEPELIDAGPLGELADEALLRHIDGRSGRLYFVPDGED